MIQACYQALHLWESVSEILACCEGRQLTKNTRTLCNVYCDDRYIVTVAAG